MTDQDLYPSYDSATLLHPLSWQGALPDRLNCPLCYEPDALCSLAMREVMGLLRGGDADGWEPLDGAFRREAAQGKMFGVLVVDDGSHRPCYLAGFSGQIGGQGAGPGWVPAVMDYLQPDGYFKTREAEIVAIGRRIRALAESGRRQRLADAIGRLRQERDRHVAAHRAAMRAAKQRRDAMRQSLEDSLHECGGDGLRARLIGESQFQKAELRRIKARWNARITEEEERLRAIDGDIARLKAERKQMSDGLQRWLHEKTMLLNGHCLRRGGTPQAKSVLEIFREYGAQHGRPDLLPPSGTGECCEPRLLQAAYRLGVRPLSMAMFWWGASPREEIRHEGQCYPACNAKCKPLLAWMLQGIAVMPNPLDGDGRHELRIVFEDADISVVDKPSGMLSVPGKNGRESVESVMRRRLGVADGCPIIVHRLDMDTSGLMVVAHHERAYHQLQDQFLRHEVRKRYEALLERPLPTERGTVSLPLRPDRDDRPRQVVDPTHGKEAVTRYERTGSNRVSLWPETGRTHQLRVHCAHREGLDDPIRGDRLYGTQHEGRLCLHAAEITFRHPATGEELTFTSAVPF